MIRIKDIEWEIVPDEILEQDEYVQKLKKDAIKRGASFDPYYLTFKTPKFSGVDIVVHDIKLVDDPDDEDRCKVQYAIEIVRCRQAIADIDLHRDEINVIVKLIINDMLQKAQQE